MELKDLAMMFAGNVTISVADFKTIRDGLVCAVENIHDHRDALKLAIGQANSRPWTDVTDAEVEEWLQRIRTIKAAKGSTGNSSS